MSQELTTLNYLTGDPHRPPHNSDVTIETISPSYRVRVEYAGLSRETPAERKELIDFWAEHRESYRDRAVSPEVEYMVREGSAPYWLAAEDGLTERLAEELRGGDLVELVVTRIGTVKISGEVNWVFLINDFRKLEK